ncbi:hypothetical protein [Halorubrum aquaticum]|nr:hypothetical protein [Halorubrum aquaticum]
MPRSPEDPTPPEGLPDRLVAELEDLSPEDLRKTIVHARELLRFHEERDLPIEPEPGEDVVRITEHEGYTEVVKRLPCEDGCDDCPHGPYVYHVTEEPQPDGETKVHWSFIGEVNVDED